MVPAALPMSERNKRETTHLVCTHNRLSALEMLPDIVDDLKKLENGIEMFDAESGQTVLVVVPVSFISADNPRHAELACSKGLSASFPCRKCYFKKKKPTELTAIQDHDAPSRLANDIGRFCNGRNLLHGVQLPDNSVEDNPANLGYKETGAEALPELSALDMTKDYPIRILHTMMLGVTKYLVTELCGYLNSNESRQLESPLRHYNSKAFSREMNSNLQLQKSFAGRDYKLLAQQLPLILSNLLGMSGPTSTPAENQ